MRPILLSVGPYSAGSVNSLATAQAPTTGTPLTLTGTAIDTPRRLLLTFGNDVTVNRRFVLVGTGWSGNVISETLTIPTGAGTIVSQLDYKTLTSATPTGANWAANVSLGTSTTGTNTPMGSSAWARLDDYGFASVNLGLDINGVANVTVQMSDDDPNLVPPQVPVVMASMVWINHPVLSNQDASAMSEITSRPLWVRLVCNSATATSGSATLAVNQAGGKFG